MDIIYKIARKELKSYFVSPMGYVVISLFSVISGWFFFNHINRFNSLVTYYQMAKQPEALNQLNLNQFVVIPLFKQILMLLNIFLPAVTMRLFAEEKKQKTIELLFTSPIHTHEIILGKYLAVLCFLLLMLGITVIHPVILYMYGSPGPEFLPILTGYVGLFLVGACILSVGIFASSITENQIIAFVIALSVSMLFYIIGLPASTIGGPVGQFLSYLSISEHFNGLAHAFVDTRIFIYYFSFILAWLFVTYRVIEGLRIK